MSQIQSILDDEKTSALVIAPVDAYGLNDVLEQAYEKSIPVISYDQLIMDTDKINYYVTFDTRKAGKWWEIPSSKNGSGESQRRKTHADHRVPDGFSG